MKIWYARVSSYGQNFETQVEKLKEFGCEKIFTEKMSWASTKQRHELKAALEYCREGDVFAVTKLDRLARSMFDLQNISKWLQNKSVNFVVLDQHIDTTSPFWQLAFNLIGSVAQFERDLIQERVHEWIARAKAKGIMFWARLKLNDQQVQEMQHDLKQGMTRKEACEKYKISMTTCYRLCPAREVFDTIQI